MIYDNILKTIGSTPIVKLNSIGSHLECTLFAKLELFNPGGSVKDRIALEMVECAERSGKIKPGDTLIEPSSGNTGIGLALAAAVKGYKLIIVMPEKMSMEKELILKALGAEIIRTRTAAAHNEEDSLFGVARKLNREMKNSHMLDQYKNDCNPEAHYKFTAQEILDDFGTDLHMIVMGVGTGGTITGVGKRLKKEIPGIKIIGADPYGSIRGGGDEVHPYHVEGIGYDFFPEVLDNSIIDEYVKVNDKDTFRTAKSLIKDEGLLIGGSSGTAVFAALEAAKSLKKGQNCLVILPDGIRNYMRKFVSDDWMKENDLI